jgi:AhpD family alkylhydroperoxidase
MGHTPEHLAASWPRSRYCYGQKSSLTLAEKHLLTLAISATNNCEYCVRSHTVRLRQLGTTEAELVELLELVHAANGWSKLAEGVRLGDDATIPPVPGGKADAGDTRSGNELAAAFGASAAGEIARILAHSRPQLEVLSRAVGCLARDGKLGVGFKQRVALSIAACNGSDYFVDVHTRQLRERGMSDAQLAELIFIIDVVCGYNRYVQGLQVDPREGLKPWGRHAEANRNTG